MSCLCSRKEVATYFNGPFALSSFQQYFSHKPWREWGLLFFLFFFLLYFCKENIFSAPCLRVALIVSEISISQASWHLHPLSTFSYNSTTNTTTFMLLNSLYKHKLKMLNRFVIFTMRLILMTSLWNWFENTHRLI